MTIALGIQFIGAFQFGCVKLPVAIHAEESFVRRAIDYVLIFPTNLAEIVVHQPISSSRSGDIGWIDRDRARYSTGCGSRCREGVAH